MGLCILKSLAYWPKPLGHWLTGLLAQATKPVPHNEKNFFTTQDEIFKKTILRLKYNEHIFHE